MKKPSTTYHHGNLRSDLVAAAIDYLEGGNSIATISVRELASTCGVSAGAPYRHFPSSESLIAAIAARGFEMLDDSLRSASDQTKGGIVDMGMAYIRFAAAHAELYRAMFHLPQRDVRAYPELSEASSRAYGRLARSLGEADGSVHVTAAWAFVHGIADLIIHEYTTAITPDDEPSLRSLVATLEHGLTTQ